MKQRFTKFSFWFRDLNTGGARGRGAFMLELARWWAIQGLHDKARLDIEHVRRMRTTFGLPVIP